MDKGYYCRSEYVHLWVHLLMKANHEPKELLFCGKIMHLEPGQLITGRKALSGETRIKEGTVQRILKVFEREKQIEQQTFNKFRLITIQNWNDYQQSEQQMNNKRTASEQLVNTNKNVRREECKKKEKKGVAKTSFAPPDHLQEIWPYFIEMRKSIKSKPTDHACNLIVKKLEKLAPGDKQKQIKIVEQSIENSYKGVFPLKDDRSYNSNAQLPKTQLGRVTKDTIIE